MEIRGAAAAASGCHSRVAARVPVPEQHMAHGLGVAGRPLLLFSPDTQSLPVHELYADGVRLDFQDSRRILRYHGGFQSRWRAAIRMAGGNWLRLRLGRIA